MDSFPFVVCKFGRIRYYRAFRGIWKKMKKMSIKSEAIETGAFQILGILALSDAFGIRVKNSITG